MTSLGGAIGRSYGRRATDPRSRPSRLSRWMLAQPGVPKPPRWCVASARRPAPARHVVDRPGGGESRGVAWRGVERDEPPTCRPIVVAGDAKQARGLVGQERDVEVGEWMGEAFAERFDEGLLARPRGEECGLERRRLERTQRGALGEREEAFGDRDGVVERA